MVNSDCRKTYIEILETELIEATGCTEPIALALAGAKLKEALTENPEHIEVLCSGNMVKNVKGVTVPNSGGLRGIDTAVLLGVIGGDPTDALQVISKASDEDRKVLKEELTKGYVDTQLVENVPNLYILVKGKSKNHSAEVEIVNYHTNVTKIVKDGKVIFNKEAKENVENVHEPDKSLLNIKDIVAFAETVDIKDVYETIHRQVVDNSAISQEGLKGNYGAMVGKTLYENANDVYTRARAAAAAGSDARMNGCPMPVVINSGSGNQGMTLSLPIVQFCKEMNIDEEKMIRALVIANLIAVHQKKYIGSLSAYCGAVSAATGSACGIAWLKGDDVDTISKIITNSICTVGGMVCDGAKSSCAGKIAVALESAFMAMKMAEAQRAYVSGEGLVKDEPEDTIKAVGRMAREGMRSTDKEILNIMLEK